MTLIHVVIPVYNAKQFLRETVASVLNQPYQGIEIVLVDDGSTDGSGRLCDELAAQNDRVTVIHQENAGVSAARNVGIEFFLRNGTQGYLAFLDADDLWCPNVFTTHFVEEIVATAADVVGFSVYGSNLKAKRFQILSSYQREQLDFSEKYQSSFLWAKGHFGAHLYDISLLRENTIRFVVGCKLNEDVIFSAKALFCSQRIVLLDRYLYIYRRNKGSVTGRNTYHLGNARHIPDAWYSASDFAESCFDISEEAANRWQTFCLDTSAVRCLEVMHSLAENGYLRRIKRIPFVYQMKALLDNRKYTLSVWDIGRDSQ